MFVSSYTVVSFRMKFIMLFVFVSGSKLRKGYVSTAFILSRFF